MGVDVPGLHRVATRLQGLARPLWGSAIACATVGVFWLPWYFPSRIPALGESYVLGFNNRLSLIALALGIAAATAARLAGSDPAPGIDWLAKRTRLLPALKAARVEYLILAVCAFLWTQVLWSWCIHIVDPAYGDSRGMIYGIDLIALGRIPYRDFVFNYGAAHIYLPYWLSWLTNGGISFEHSYAMLLMLLVITGFLSIFMFLRALRMRSSTRPVALALVLASWALFCTSTAHMPMRFLCVPAGVVCLHAFIAANPARAVGTWCSAAAIAAGIVLVCLALSPEMGIAGSVAIAGYAAGLLALQRKSGLAAACVAGCVAAVAVTVLVFPEYFLTVVAFATGFGNIPVYPNPQNLLVVAAAVYVFSSLLASALQHPDDARSPLAFGLAMGGGLLLVGCFGRAAPVHVFSNAMTPLLVMFAAASRWGRVPRRLWPVAYALVEIVLLQISWWWAHYGTYSTAVALRKFYDANPAVVETWRQQWAARRAKHPAGKHLHWSSVLPYPADLDQFEDKGTIIQTGASEWNLWLGRYLLLQRETPRDFFTPWLLTACTPPQIQRRLTDLRAARYLLAPEGDVAGIEHPIDNATYEQGLDRWLSVTMAYPVRSKVRFTPYAPDIIQLKQLLGEYKPIGRFQFFMYMPFVLFEKRDDS